MSWDAFLESNLIITIINVPITILVLWFLHLSDLRMSTGPLFTKYLKSQNQNQNSNCSYLNFTIILTWSYGFQKYLENPFLRN